MFLTTTNFYYDPSLQMIICYEFDWARIWSYKQLWVSSFFVCENLNGLQVGFQNENSQVSPIIDTHYENLIASSH